MARLSKRDRAARLLSRRRNQLLAGVRDFMLSPAAQGDPLRLVELMVAYVEALPLPRRQREQLASGVTPEDLDVRAAGVGAAVDVVQLKRGRPGRVKALPAREQLTVEDFMHPPPRDGE